MKYLLVAFSVLIASCSTGKNPVTYIVNDAADTDTTIIGRFSDIVHSGGVWYIVLDDPLGDSATVECYVRQTPDDDTVALMQSYEFTFWREPDELYYFHNQIRIIDSKVKSSWQFKAIIRR